MIPHDIDRERYDYLVRWGIKPGELKAFFKERRTPLLRCGVKVQNPPADPAAAEALIHQFSKEAHRVFGTWIQELEDDECTVGPNQWVPRYRAIEECGVDFPAEDMKAMARAGLKELYKENPRADWIRFLSSPRSRDTEEVVVSIEPKVSMPSEAEWLAFGRWLCGVGTVDDVENPVLRDAVAILAKWDRRASPTELTTDDGRRALPVIEKLIEDTERPAALDSVRKGLRSSAPATRAREDDVDYLALLVVATRVHSPRSGPYMAKVEAFVDDGGPFRLEDAELRDVIRTQGRVAIFPDRGFAEPPFGEAIMYKVESHVTNLPVQVRVREVLARGLIPVVRLPHTTKEAHQIRKDIEQYARTTNAHPAIFVTADDFCLKPEVDPLARVLTQDFDWVLDTWDHLEGLELSSGTYVLAPLPPRTGKLSCAPLAAAARQLLRDTQRRSQAGITKAQAKVLQEMLQEESLGIEDLSRERLAENIASISASGEDYDELVRLLMTSTVVRADVNRLVQLRVEELTAEKQKETRAIDSLRHDRGVLENRLRELQSEAEKKAKDVRAAVVKAFKKASSNEIEALGEASVLLSLIGRDLPDFVRAGAALDSTPTKAVVADPVPALPVISIRKSASSSGAVTDVIRRFGISAETSERVDLLLCAALALGLPIVARGSGARSLAEQLLIVLSKNECTICEVPIGLIANERLESRLAEGSGGVLFLDANLSDLSVYAPGILDAVVAGALGAKNLFTSRPLMFSLASGPAGLPLPAELDELAVDLDLNVLSGPFVAEGRTQLQPQGALVTRALKRFDSDPALVNLGITLAVLDDLNWTVCRRKPNTQ